MTAALAERPVPVVTDQRARRSYAADHLTLAAVPTALSCARMFVRFTLQNWRASRECVEIAELLTSELISNALKATGIPELPINPDVSRHLNLVRLRLVLFADSVAIEVWDNDPRPPIPQEPSLDAEGGRGLLLIAEMSRCWSYYPARNGGKVVWYELDLLLTPAPVNDATIEFLRPLPRRKRYTGPVHPAEVMKDPNVLKRVLEGLHALDSDEQED